MAVTTSSTGTSELRLRANNAGAPGALIESLGSQTLPSAGSTQLTFSSPGHPTLSANTTYWVTLGETGSGDFNWDGTTSTAQSGAWTIGDQALFSSNGGATWADVSFGPPNESAKFAVDASVVVATQYSMVGKFARSSGAFIDIPLVVGAGGNCGATTVMGAKAPGMTPIYQGVRTDVTMIPDPVTTLPIMSRFANRHGCVSGMGQITATNAGVGAAFKMPTNAFARGLPGMIVAASVPRVGALVQLATSFAVSGPPMTIPMAFTTMGAATVDHPAGTMIVRVPNTPMGVPQNLAEFRSFHKSAWKTQTGRAGPAFTWCFGNPACTKVTQGGPGPYSSLAPVIVKYNAGPNRFGGTMSNVIGAGTNPSSLALASPAFGVVFLDLKGMGSQPTGRGYADRLTDPLNGSINWFMYMTKTISEPVLGPQMLITMVSSPGPVAINLQNVNYGFPLTTGTVLVCNTGRSGPPGNNPLVVTLTAKGKDSITPMGARNISLVAGAVAAVPNAASPGGESHFEIPTLVQIAMPEPTGEAQWLAGAAALLTIALWRSRRRRD